MRESGPRPPCDRKASSDPSATLHAAPEPPNNRGGLEQRLSAQSATNPSTLDPARRRRIHAPVSQRRAHWERGWRVAEGRFGLWMGYVVGSGG